MTDVRRQGRAWVALAVVVAGCSSGYSSTSTSATAVHYTASMSASNERNADGTPKTINSTATGTANLSLLGDTLTYVINVTGLSGAAVASHIHAGGPSVNGPIVLPFAITSGVSNGTLASGKVALSTTLTTITADSLKALLNSGNAYVNVHTAANAAGEMRGQIARQ